MRHRHRTSSRTRRRMAWVISTAVFLATTGSLLDHPVVAATRPEATEVAELHFLSDVCGVPIAADGTIHTSSTALDGDRILQHIRVDLLLTANGRIAYERPSFSVVVDRVAGTVTLEGTLVNISAPGEGILLKDAGRIVRDLGSGSIVDVAGMWMVLEGRFDRVCTYLAS